MIGFANLLVCTGTSCCMKFINKKQDETGQRTFRKALFNAVSFFSVRSEKRANCLRVRIHHGKDRLFLKIMNHSQRSLQNK